MSGEQPRRRPGNRRRLSFGLLAVVIGALLLSAWLQPAYHRGPVSDHFDGVRFFMPDAPIGKGLLQVLRWKLTSRAAQWPESIAVPPPAQPVARIHGGDIVATWVGHATVLVQTAGLNILTDPIWAERASLVSFAGPRRVAPPGIRFADLPPIDVVLVSHSHFDHMDLPTLQRLHEAHDPLFVMGLGMQAILRPVASEARMATLDWFEAVAVDDDIRIHAVPVRHWSRRRLWDRNMALWAGFVVSTPQGQIYFGGDTGLGDGQVFRDTAARFDNIRLAILPVGAYAPRWFMRPQHVDPAEAVELHQILGATHSLGMHHSTFQLTDEAIDAPRLELAKAVAAAGLEADTFHTLPIGGELFLPAPAGVAVDWTDGTASP